LLLRLLCLLPPLVLLLALLTLLQAPCDDAGSSMVGHIKSTESAASCSARWNLWQGPMCLRVGFVLRWDGVACTFALMGLAKVIQVEWLVLALYSGPGAIVLWLLQGQLHQVATHHPIVYITERAAYCLCWSDYCLVCDCCLLIDLLACYQQCSASAYCCTATCWLLNWFY
jgi:hypothetical protein